MNGDDERELEDLYRATYGSLVGALAAPGHAGHVTAEGQREILDANGNTLATEGQSVHVTGGASGHTTHVPGPPWTPICHPDEPQYTVTKIAPGTPDAYPSS